MTLTRIISGAQTGADLGALRAGLALGMNVGGWMPRGFVNELGARPWFAKMYGIQEHASPQFLPRTIANIEMSDGTVLIGDLRSPGSRRTLGMLRGKPGLVNPTPEALRAFVDEYAIRTLNVAGNRESVNRGMEAYTYRLLIETWAEGAERERLRKSAPWPDPIPKGVWVPGDEGEA